MIVETTSAQFFSALKGCGANLNGFDGKGA